jgi:hypothetical protein
MRSYRRQTAPAGRDKPCPLQSSRQCGLRDNLVGAGLVPARPVPEGCGEFAATME